jgi:hypothetical protein
MEPLGRSKTHTRAKTNHNLLISLVENTGFEPHPCDSPPDASTTHIRAQTPHINALRPARSSHETPHNAPTIHEQHTAVHAERARSVHADPALAAVTAAWLTLPDDIQAQILALVQSAQPQRGEVQ